MRLFCYIIFAVAYACVISGSSASAAVVETIDFEDNELIPGNFFAHVDQTQDPDEIGLGIAGSGPSEAYQGFSWGFSSGGLPFNSPTDSDDAATGWAVGSSTGSGYNFSQRPENGGDPNNFGWNYRSPRSLVIEFPRPYTVTAASFAELAFLTTPSASRLTLHGWNADLTEVTGPEAIEIDLNESLTQSTFNLPDITYFEIRSDVGGTLFAVDDIAVSAVPEPSSLALLGFVAAGGAVRYRRRSRSKQP